MRYLPLTIVFLSWGCSALTETEQKTWNRLTHHQAELVLEIQESLTQVEALAPSLAATTELLLAGTLGSSELSELFHQLSKLSPELAAAAPLLWDQVLEWWEIEIQKIGLYF